MTDKPTPRMMKFPHPDWHEENEMCANAGCLPVERQAMSDNPTPQDAPTIVQDVERGYESRASGMGPRIDIPQPPAPRLSEDEIQRVSKHIARYVANNSREWTTSCIGAILSILNEEKKA